MRRRPERPPEHRDERARAVVADVECDGRDRPAGGQQSHRVQQPELLPPLAERHAGFLLEKPLERPGAGGHPSGDLFDQARVVGMRPQPCRRTLRPFIRRQGKLQRNGRQALS